MKKRNTSGGRKSNPSASRPKRGATKKTAAPVLGVETPLSTFVASGGISSRARSLKDVEVAIIEAIRTANGETRRAEDPVIRKRPGMSDDPQLILDTINLKFRSDVALASDLKPKMTIQQLALIIGPRLGESAGASRSVPGLASRTSAAEVREQAAGLAELQGELAPARHPGPTVNHSRDHLRAYVSVRSLGGLSLFSGAATPRKENIAQFKSDPRDVRAACRRLQEMGCLIERIGPLSVRIAAPASVFEQRLGIQFNRAAADSMLVPAPGSNAVLLNLGVPEVEGMVFPQPTILHAAAAAPPTPGYHHLKPADVARIMRATEVHAKGHYGQNVRAAMIDSGFDWKHPYFRNKGYDLKVSLPEDINQDFHGHGTGESANLLAVAPKVRLHGLSMADPIEAFQIARDDLGVQLISNSWGSKFDTDGPGGFWEPYWKQVEAEIALCAQQGIVVLFSGGNGQTSFTASMPETISVGGVYVDEAGNYRASDYASSFDSTRYPGEHVPEVCGLSGMLPQAIYITLPIPEGCVIDRELGGGAFPNGDETGKSDGWGVFSGTSAACPMVAGVVALMLSKHPDISPSEVRRRLRLTRDITIGRSFMGDAAGPGYDKATGFGLVDAVLACA